MDDEFYFKDGVSYDRPTRILDYFANEELVEWKMRVGKREAGRISREALKCGKRLDEIIRAGAVPSSKDKDKVKAGYEAWENWKAHFQPNRIIFPETVYCDTRMVAGTPDFYLEDNRDLVDIKLAKRVHENYFFQLGFYASALPYPVRRLAVLRLDPDTKLYEYATNEQMGLSVTDCINGFNGLLIYFRLYKCISNKLTPTKIEEESE